MGPASQQRGNDLLHLRVAPVGAFGDFHANFATALMYKDLGLAGEIAKELNIPTPALALAREMLNMALAKGYGREDVCSVVKCYEEWAHIEVRK